MRPSDLDRGRETLINARKESRALYWVVGVFSCFTNLLMLTGPIYMLQVYDRVLGSRSVATLIALTLLVAFLYAMMGVLDYARGRIMARIAARFQDRLDGQVFDVALKQSMSRAPLSVAATAQRDLESVQRLLASPALMALFDLPWTPLFLIGIALFHPWLGLLAAGGGAVLVALTLLNQLLSRRSILQANLAGFQADRLADQIKGEAELIQSLGLRKSALLRWQAARSKALQLSILANDISGTFTAMTKTLRLFLQSAMLGLGAYLVLQGQMTPGAMIAGSILMGRALAPVEQIIGQWAVVQRGVKGWRNLVELMAGASPARSRTLLPRPKARLEVQAVTVLPPGHPQATLNNISFSLQPGQAVGVIGPSGAGKTTLARVLTGAWHPASGKLCLDGAALDQYDPDRLGDYIGYLPQRVPVFDGTIADNIAGLQPDPDPDRVVAAAQKAAAHEMILTLPHGYDTVVTAQGTGLSGGQLQRLGLARALYRDPVILVLDEPNANLDSDGTAALNQTIRSMKSAGGGVLIMAHRPAAIKECDVLLVLENGHATAFGPKETVLRDMVKNHADLHPTQIRGVS